MSVPVLLPDTTAADPPPVLMDYQRRWVADGAPLKVIEKSRRTGLTWGEAADNVLTAAASRAAGGQNVYYIAYNQDMTIEYVQACAMWARAFNHAASEIEEGFWEEEDADRHIKTFTIRFPASGFRIVALSSRPSNLRGRQGTIVIDEAAFHDQLEELLKAALAMLIWGGRVRVISTHNGADNAFAELVEDIRAGKRRGAVHRIVFRDAVADGLYQRVCLRLGKPWSASDEASWVDGVYAFYGAGAEEELDCVPAQGGGAYLSRALIESRMVPTTPVLRFEAPKGFEVWPQQMREAHVRDWCEAELLPILRGLPSDARSYFGLDFGRLVDLSVLIPLLESSDLICRTPFVLEMRSVPFEQQKQLTFYVADRLPRLLKAALDARGNGQYLAEVTMQRYGIGRVDQVMLSDKWYLEHMAPFKAALEDGTLADLPRDAGVLDDLRAIELVRGVPKIADARTTSSDGGKRHGDAAVACVLAHYASRHAGVEIEYTSAPPRTRFSEQDDGDIREDRGAW